MDIVTVRVARPEASQVVLWERHPGHPTGEVFLAGAGSFEVGLTPAVKARLRDGRLVAVDRADTVGRVDTVDPASLSLAKGKEREEPAIAPAATPRPRKGASARKGGL